jgi:hypothetical protein
MIDPDAIETCTNCLLGAALELGDDADMALSARAIARDLADAYGTRASALLEAAAREAIGHLDRSGLKADAFAATLRRLATIRTRTVASLQSIAVSPAPA